MLKAGRDGYVELRLLLKYVSSHIDCQCKLMTICCYNRPIIIYLAVIHIFFINVKRSGESMILKWLIENYQKPGHSPKKRKHQIRLGQNKHIFLTQTLFST